MNENTDKFNKYVELQKILCDLTTSPLYEYRIKNNYKPVLGEGNLNACIMFVGEAPGAKEAQSGRPFIGPAGRVLTTLLDEIKIKREDVFITSIVHDRPPHNRKPTKEEIKLYFPILENLINLIQPKILVTLGNTSYEGILKNYASQEEIKPISQTHGISFKLQSGIIVFPVFHPAYLLYQATKRDVLVQDFLALKELQSSIN